MPLLARNSSAVKKSEQGHLDSDTDMHCTPSLVSVTTLSCRYDYLLYKCWLTDCPPYGLLAGGHTKCSAFIMSFHFLS